MSLVNDMLRDLEARHAPPLERAPLEGLLPADEGAAARRAGRRRLLLALPLLGGAALAALLLARPWATDAAAAPVVAPPPAGAVAQPAPAAAAPVPAPLPVAPEPATAAAGEPPVRLLATLPQHGRERFVLQLLLVGGLGCRVVVRRRPFERSLVRMPGIYAVIDARTDSIFCLRSNR